MKRYNFDGSSFPEVKESSTGEYVKYEPWMDEAILKGFNVPGIMEIASKFNGLSKIKFSNEVSEAAAKEVQEDLQNNQEAKMRHEQLSNLKPKRPTICAECRYKINLDNDYRVKNQDIPLYIKSEILAEISMGSNNKPFLVEIRRLPYCVVFQNKVVDYINGMTQKEIINYGYCRDKNHGDCPDFEKKES